MKKKAEEANKESKEDVRNLLLHLESEYRKANISEKQYKDLKEKYNKIIKGSTKEIVQEEEPKKDLIPENEEIDEEKTEEVEEEIEEPVETKKEPEEKVEKKGFFKSLFGNKKESDSTEQPPQDTEKPVSVDPPKKVKKEEDEEITEMTPEVIERLAQKAKEEAEGQTEEAKEGSKEKKSGFLKSIFGKKEGNAPSEAEIQENAPEVQTEEKNKSSSPDYVVEIEKLKVMIDTVRESGKVTDETARGVSESIGEIRSMVFQADAELKEVALKMEKIEDEITEVKPQEIQKKFREFNENFEKHQLELEKLGKKAEDAGEKIVKVLEMLKSIGGIENLSNVNAQIQKKLEDVNEAMKYIERIGTKTEKMFIDLNRGLQDLIVIRAKQDDFNESLKDTIKTIDSVNVKFEGYVTKKDLDVFKEDNVLIKKDIEDIRKILPVAELKLPEKLINLRKEREDINLLIDSLDEQHSNGKISKEEYESIKNANMKRLEEIRVSLENEWKKVAVLIKPEKEEAAQTETPKIEEETPEKIEKSKPSKNMKKEKVASRKVKKIKPKTKKSQHKKVIKQKTRPKKIAKPESQRKAEILSSLKKLT
jgi:hypothetical protein